MRHYLGDGYIYLPPRCPECKTDKPNEIEDAEHRGMDATLQCRTCGHVWDRATLRITNVRIDYGWHYEMILVPIEQKQLTEGE